MAAINLITENIILPFSDLFTGYSISRDLKFLMESQWWNRKQIDDFQNEKLNKLIEHSVKSVPYYHDLFKRLGIKAEDIKSKDDLNRLPILTKEIIKKEGLKRFTTISFSKNILIKSSSSGSTGEPLLFYSTRESESLLKASAIRGWYWMGYKLGDKYVKISMNPRSSRIKRIQDSMNRCLYLSSTQLTDQLFTRIIQSIEKFNPKFIRSYPVPLFFLAKKVEKLGGIKLPGLVAINTTGSTLHKDVRDKVQNIFNTKIFDSYGCEGGTTFFQCENLENYHPAEEYAISEFIEDRFTKGDEEKSLRHITTDLSNLATPFIRYDTQDYVVLGDKSKCKCGRCYTNINKIKGRDSDILITPSGKYLIVENFVAYFEWIRSIEQFQVYQEKLNLIKMRFIINKFFTEKVKKDIYDYWTNYIGEDVELIFEIVSEIKLTPTGKRRNVIRNPEIKLDG